ncbi:hypothetical protein JYT36_00440 [Bacteroidales bacterium AH-315-N07]|nr:hypothetical protein [Bacteroidales bacterium AH-315-N07]
MKFFNLLPVLIFSFNFSFSQNLLDTEHTKKYANYLFNIGDYELASEEFQRLVFLANSDSAKFFLSICHRKTGKIQKSLGLLGSLLPNVKWKKVVVPEYMKSLTLSGQHVEAINFGNQNRDDKISYIIAGNMILNNDFKAAKNLIDPKILLNRASKTEQKLYNLAEKGMNIRYKSPFVASFCSVVIPGLGKAYSKRWQDGLISFVLVGTSVWQAYTGFDGKGISSIKGWIFTFFGASFYLSNIYGSFIAAKHFNKKSKKDIEEETKVVITGSF